MRLSRKLFDLLRAHPEFEALTQNLSITTFRYVPPALRAKLGEPAIEASLNSLNEELLARVEKSGRAFLSNAVIDGKFAMRACIVNFRTSDADIEALPEIVRRDQLAIASDRARMSRRQTSRFGRDGSASAVTATPLRPARRFATLHGYEKRSLALVPAARSTTIASSARAMSASAASARRRLARFTPRTSNANVLRSVSALDDFTPPKSVTCRTECHQEGPLDADRQRERRALVDERGDVSASHVIRREIRRMGRRDPAQRDEHHKAKEQSSEHQSE